MCAYPSAITLAPGESTTEAWGGQFATSETALPLECLASGQLSRSACERIERVEPGTFTFLVQAGTAIDCEETTTTCGACTAIEGGGCSTHGALITGPMLTATATVTLDATYGVAEPAAGIARVPVSVVFDQEEDL